MTLTYELGENERGQKNIKCLVCEMVSYSPDDRSHRYCGRCHQFHPIQVEVPESGRFPKTHNYRKQDLRWGHAIASLSIIDEGVKLKVSGWGKGIQSDDFMHFSHPGHVDEVTRYKVDKIDYMVNPPDMWMAELSFAPLQGAEEAA